MWSQEEPPEEGSVVSSRLLRLIMLGIGLVFVGVAVLAVAAIMAGGSGSGSVGGVIFIGPIPIVFGAGPDSGWLITISIIIAVIMVGLFWILNRRPRS
jgi:uncharacterized membrane protein